MMTVNRKEEVKLILEESKGIFGWAELVRKAVCSGGNV